MESFVRTRPVFDVIRTAGKVGILAEALRHSPGAKRSLHPTHPVCAVGRRAAELVEGHQRSLTPQGPETPFARLVEWGGYVLRIGTHAYPLAHRVQEAVDYPNLFLPNFVALTCVDERERACVVETRVFRPRLPFVLYMDGAVESEPVPMNIADFPLLYGGGRERKLGAAREKGVALKRLLEIRKEFESRDEMAVETVNGCVCDFFPLRSSFAFATSEIGRLIERYKSCYDVSRLERGLERGTIRI